MHSLLLVSLILSLAINICLFLIAYSLQSDKLTDASYSLSFIALAVYDYLKSSHHAYSLIASLLVLVWAIRIGSFLIYRVFKVGKDRRFDGMREHFFKFAQFWLGQALTVWLLMIPLALASKQHKSFKFIVALGLIVWLIGLGIEAIADIEKYKFHNDPKSKNAWIDSGLWHYSRHPNYFGEILVWVGIYLYTFNALSGLDKLIALISPIFITLLLRYVSGIPILEKSADQKWGSNKEYKLYKKSTSLLVLLPKK